MMIMPVSTDGFTLAYHIDKENKVLTVNMYMYVNIYMYHLEAWPMNNYTRHYTKVTFVRACVCASVRPGGHRKPLDPS
jgi:hypothetical protein